MTLKIRTIDRLKIKQAQLPNYCQYSNMHMDDLGSIAQLHAWKVRVIPIALFFQIIS